MQVYCLKCKAHRDVSDPEAITLKNGRQATKGTCSVCGKSVFRIGSV